MLISFRPCCWSFRGCMSCWASWGACAKSDPGSAPCALWVSFEISCVKTIACTACARLKRRLASWHRRFRPPEPVTFVARREKWKHAFEKGCNHLYTSEILKSSGVGGTCPKAFPQWCFRWRKQMRLQRRIPCSVPAWSERRLKTGVWSSMKTFPKKSWRHRKSPEVG